ncbi:hypothetical protein [Foetidibacter luteolus]|uniref:hypothetical protein n=1 Tax=Foetidibacter luteolus TaxID=2608880 RepID=UPI00129BEF39|nr:hypothetical protein [Foetidibacter luteolus]
MKKCLPLLLVIFFATFSCKKDCKPKEEDSDKISLENAVVVKEGSFVFSKQSAGSGRAVVYRQVNGKYVLGLEQMSLNAGHDLDVYLSTAVTGGKAVKLFSIRVVDGKFYYELPAGINAADFAYILFISDTANEPVAVAALK